MTAKNDNQDLSRSNLESNEKADSSDFGALSGTEVANPPIYKRFFRSFDDVILYNTVEEISQWLSKRPGLIPDYQSGMLRLADQHAYWNDYRGMRENCDFLVDVLIRVAVLRGEKHLA